MSSLIKQMLRVNQAGELTACRIYQGQMAILGGTDFGKVIQKMWDQEKEHLAKFNEKCIEFDSRPTLLSPICTIGGWALGATTALIGKECAMACTEAVENVVSEHYNNQLRDLLASPLAKECGDLISLISKCRDEELEHRDTAIEYDAHKVFHPSHRRPLFIHSQISSWRLAAEQLLPSSRSSE